MQIIYYKVSSESSTLPATFTSVSTTTPSASSDTVCTASSFSTASQKKLTKSLHTPHNIIINSNSDSSESDFETFDVYYSDDQGMRLLEVAGLQEALKESVCCKKCGDGAVIFKEDFSRKQGLNTSPFLYCESCSHRVPIPFSFVGDSKVLAVNLKTSFVSKCAGGNFSSLQMFCSILDLPRPVTKNVHTST